MALRGKHVLRLLLGRKNRCCLLSFTLLCICLVIVARFILSSRTAVIVSSSPTAGDGLDEESVDEAVIANISLLIPRITAAANTRWISKNLSVEMLEVRPNTSCTALIEGSSEEQKMAKNFMHAHFRVPIMPDDYIRWTRDCEDFRSRRKYVMDALPEEIDFPLAFSIVMFKDVEQTERLLRAVYRPHNYVCIHVDAKADAKVKDAMAAIASCLPGVFLHPQPAKVVWAEFSVLEADLICMKALLALRKWRYFINLTGQEFPLKTNLQLVRILQAYNGGNDVDGFTGATEMEKRWIPGGPLPKGFRGVLGGVHIVVNRQWVHYILTNDSALTFLEWVKKTRVPDETFFASLNHNQHLKVPGGYSGRYLNNEIKPYLARYKIWVDKTRCTGKFVRQVCIFAIGDLPALTSAREVVANKFHLEFSPLTLDCMEKWYFQQVAEELQTKGGNSRLDLCWYRTRGFAEHHFPLSNLSTDHFLLHDLYNISAAVSSSSSL